MYNFYFFLYKSEKSNEKSNKLLWQGFVLYDTFTATVTNQVCNLVQMHLNVF